jgi:hypothetical protein
MKEAIAARLSDLIATAEKLKATVAAERPSALLSTFPLMRLGIDVDGMATALQGHAERLSPQSAGSSGN